MRRPFLLGTLLVSLLSVMVISSPASASTAVPDIGQPLSAAAQARAAEAIPARLPAAQSPTTVGTAAAVNPLYALSPSKDGVWMYLGSTWQNVGGPAAAIYSGGTALAATTPQNGDIYAWQGSGTSWVKVGGPGWDFAIDDARRLYGLNANGVYQWNGGQNWVQIGGPAALIRAGGNGGLIATSPQTGDVYRYQGGGSWAKIGGPGQDFGIDTSGRVYGLNSNGVYEWAGGQSWTQVGGPAARIYVGGFLVATTPQNGDVYRYLGSGSWVKAGGPGTMFSVSQDPALYGLNGSGVYQWTGGESWVQVGGPAATIAS